MNDVGEGLTGWISPVGLPVTVNVHPLCMYVSIFIHFASHSMNDLHLAVHSYKNNFFLFSLSLCPSFRRFTLILIDSWMHNSFFKKAVFHISYENCSQQCFKNELNGWQRRSRGCSLEMNLPCLFCSNGTDEIINRLYCSHSNTGFRSREEEGKELEKRQQVQRSISLLQCSFQMEQMRTMPLERPSPVTQPSPSDCHRKTTGTFFWQLEVRGKLNRVPLTGQKNNCPACIIWSVTFVLGEISFPGELEAHKILSQTHIKDWISGSPKSNSAGRLPIFCALAWALRGLQDEGTSLVSMTASFWLLLLL